MPFKKFYRPASVVSCVKSAVSGGAVDIRGAEGSIHSFIIHGIFEALNQKLLVVVPTEREAQALACDLEACMAAAGTPDVPIAVFPSWGTMPYRELSPLQAVFGERTAALCALAELAALPGAKPAIVIAAERAFLTPAPPPDYFNGLLIPVRAGDALDTASLIEKLISYGYNRSTNVQLHGEFVLRGEVFDIFMSGDELAYRIVFDYDKIESIKRFNPENQSGAGNVESFTIRPMKEVVWDDERIEKLEKGIKALPVTEKSDIAERNSKQISQILDDAARKKAFFGEELFYPLCFDKNHSLLDYLSGKDRVVFLEKERLSNADEPILREYTNTYRAAAREKFVPPPSSLLFSFADLEKAAPNVVSFLTLKSETQEAAVRQAANIQLNCGPARSFFGNIDFLREEFTGLIKAGWDITIAAESEIQAMRIGELLKDLADSGQPDACNIITAPLSAGFALPDEKLMLVAEAEIFGRRSRQPASLKTTRSEAIDTFVELEPGDFVVHIQYGIGLFKGIERIRALGRERDYVKLEYAEEETVFVPIEQVNLVQRYIGNEGAPPKLDTLGSKSWEGRKAKVKKSVEDIAGRLVALYSKRKARPGFAFPADTEWQTMFEAAFPFDETEDQLRCVDEIKADMEAPYPMDRLVCGDVGYGKTEVAVRACFKAVMGGKQAAFLAPTTILVEQHYENFLQRFERFPVRIAMLSRLVEAKKAKKIVEQLKTGEIDMVVGTHRIIQKDIVFKDLGLLVIDEEQRFGVKDKERLKELKTNVDCLTLSATPIPRTLHMSLLKIRDMSLLTTPPRNRQPIETAVDAWDEERVAKAIRAEAARGGQVFFLHNRIEDLVDTRIKLEKLTPELLIDTAHGQMDARSLEDVMHRFIHGGFHVLVSTTIIENGIDIPNVNTIIIDRADRYGVSQLYQLRGRVGRSDRLAYAYLFYPRDRALSEIAMKRLQVISDFTELGSGFKIAMKDMEIRGAGNLLGSEQSGDIMSVGFDLYLRLLDEAIRKLEDENYTEESETLLDLEYSGFIPDAYIDNPQAKMEVYKKIASIRTREEGAAVTAELTDRFGPLPGEAESLLALADIRIICRALSVSMLKERQGEARVEFSRVAKVNVERLMRLIHESGGKVRLDPSAPNVIILKTGSIGLKEKSVFLRERLESLCG